MKIILLCFSLFSFPQDKFSVIEDSYPQEVVIEEIGLYQLVKTKTATKLLYNKNIVETYAENIDVLINSIADKIFVSYLLGGKVYLYVYQNGLLTQEKLFKEGLFTNLGMKVNEEEIYLYGGVKNYYHPDYPDLRKDYHQEIDCFLLSLDSYLNYTNIFLFGGYLNESIEGLYFTANNLYMWGKKDNLTGGDLGNAGESQETSFICSYPKLNELGDFLFFADETVRDLKTNDRDSDGLIILTAKAIHNSSLALEVNSSFYFPTESLFGLITINNLALNITATRMNIYATDKYDLLGEMEIIADFLSVAHTRNKIILVYTESYHEYRIYDRRAILPICDYEVATSSCIYGLDSLLAVEKLSFSASFEKTKWGLYPVSYDFGEVSIAGFIEVDFYCNIIAGRIYPYGYQLVFNGTAYLDGVLVVNSHMLESTGLHDLRIQSINGEAKSISFYVDRQQIFFSDHYYEKVNLHTLINEPFNLSFNLSVDSNTVLEKIIMNDEEVSFLYKDGEIKIPLVEKEVGYYTYHIKELVFVNNNHYWVENVDYKYNVVVGQDNLYATTSYTEYAQNLHCEVMLNDPFIQLRGLMLIISDDTETISHLLCPKDQNIDLLSLKPNALHEIQLALAYEVGGLKLKQVILFTLKVIPREQNYHLGEVIIAQRGQSIEKMTINLNKQSELSELSSNNKTLYFYKAPLYGKYIGLGLVIGGVIFISIYYFRFIFKRKHR